MELHIVRIESIRHFDEFERSYLPYMNEIFGVYKSKKEATEAVWSVFGDDKYEIEFERDECPYCDELFKYEDKKHGGVAYYGIFYHTEYLNILAGDITEEVKEFNRKEAVEWAVKHVCRCFCDDICEISRSGMCYHKYDHQQQVRNDFQYNECNQLQLLMLAMKK